MQGANNAQKPIQINSKEELDRFLAEEEKERQQKDVSASVPAGIPGEVTTGAQGLERLMADVKMRMAGQRKDIPRTALVRTLEAPIWASMKLSDLISPPEKDGRMPKTPPGLITRGLSYLGGAPAEAGGAFVSGLTQPIAEFIAGREIPELHGEGHPIAHLLGNIGGYAIPVGAAEKGVAAGLGALGRFAGTEGALTNLLAKSGSLAPYIRGAATGGAVGGAEEARGLPGASVEAGLIGGALGEKVGRALPRLPLSLYSGVRRLRRTILPKQQERLLEVLKRYTGENGETKRTLLNTIRENYNKATKKKSDLYEEFVGDLDTNNRPIKLAPDDEKLKAAIAPLREEIKRAQTEGAAEIEQAIAEGKPDKTIKKMQDSLDNQIANMRILAAGSAKQFADEMATGPYSKIRDDKEDILSSLEQKEREGGDKAFIRSFRKRIEDTDTPETVGQLIRTNKNLNESYRRLIGSVSPVDSGKKAAIDFLRRTHDEALEQLSPDKTISTMVSNGKKVWQQFKNDYENLVGTGQNTPEGERAAKLEGTHLADFYKKSDEELLRPFSPLNKKVGRDLIKSRFNQLAEMAKGKHYDFNVPLSKERAIVPIGTGEKGMGNVGLAKKYFIPEEGHSQTEEDLKNVLKHDYFGETPGTKQQKGSLAAVVKKYNQLPTEWKNILFSPEEKKLFEGAASLSLVKPTQKTGMFDNLTSLKGITHSIPGAAVGAMSGYGMGGGHGALIGLMAGTALPGIIKESVARGMSRRALQKAAGGAIEDIPSTSFRDIYKDLVDRYPFLSKIAVRNGGLSRLKAALSQAGPVSLGLSAYKPIAQQIFPDEGY